jgi:hypothetical protein
MIDSLIKLVRKCFKQVKDPRRNNISYDLSGLLNLGFAMFSFAEPSGSFERQFFKFISRAI